MHKVRARRSLGRGLHAGRGGARAYLLLLGAVLCSLTLVKVTVDVVYVTHRGKMMIKSATLERLVEGLYTESKGTQGALLLWRAVALRLTVRYRVHH